MENLTASETGTGFKLISLVSSLVRNSKTAQSQKEPQEQIETKLGIRGSCGMRIRLLISNMSKSVRYYSLQFDVLLTKFGAIFQNKMIVLENGEKFVLWMCTMGPRDLEMFVVSFWDHSVHLSENWSATPA